MTGWQTKGRVIALVVLAMLMSAVPAAAVPELQLYIEGSSYDATSETWTVTGNSFRLWVLGDVSAKGTIFDVKLTAAFQQGLAGTISLTPTTATAGTLPSPGDPSTPGAPSLVANPSSTLTPSGACGNNGTVGTLPCLSDGTKLPDHGSFGAGVQWVEFALGDFTLTDSPIGDYISSLPSSFPDTGQINAYDVLLSGFPTGATVHFDAFDHIQGKKKVRTIFAPFSHDAEGTGRNVPEPSTLLLLGSALAGGWVMLGRAARRKD